MLVPRAQTPFVPSIANSCVGRQYLRVYLNTAIVWVILQQVSILNLVSSNVFVAL
jgi:hypothetical protein